LDKMPPVNTANVAPPANAAGWNNSNATVNFNCSDATSGIAACPAPVAANTERSDQIVTGTATDKAGNSKTTSVTVNIDKTAPTITHTINPAPNAAGWNNSDATVTFNCSDPLSGVASCTSPVIVTLEGDSQVLTGTALDKAGNTSGTSVTVKLDKTVPSI